MSERLLDAGALAPIACTSVALTRQVALPSSRTAAHAAGQLSQRAQDVKIAVRRESCRLPSGRTMRRLNSLAGACSGELVFVDGGDVRGCRGIRVCARARACAVGAGSDEHRSEPGFETDCGGVPSVPRNWLA